MPVARFQTADGRIARFEVPEGTTPEQAMAMVQKEFPNLSAPANEPGLTDTLKRSAGLAVRAAGPVAGGAMAGGAIGSIVPGVGTAAGAAAGAGAMTIAQLIDKVSGVGATDKIMDMLGLPKPASTGERITSDVMGAMAGQAGVIKGAETLARPGVERLGSGSQRIIDLIRSNPKTQIIAAGGAAGGESAVREAGGGPVAQLGGSLVGGFLAPTAADVATQAVKATGRGVRAAIDPFTQGGRERVVGQTLRRSATDAEGAIDKLGRSKTLVEGSQPTTAQAAGDEGLFIAERGVSSSTPQAGGQFARRASEQNTARNAVLNAIAKDDAALKSAIGKREGRAGPLYRGAMEEGIDQGMADAMAPQIKNLTERMPKGVLEKAKELARLNGDAFDSTGSLKGLHWIKMAVDDAISSGKQTGIGAQTTRGLTQFKQDLLSVMDDLSPAYGKARGTYAELSKPVNQLEALQDVRTKVQNPGTDAASGERILSAAKFANILRKPETRAELQKVLTKDQYRALESISADLDRAALSASSGKSAGSNTVQNISTAYVLGAALGERTATNPIMQNLARPLSWVNKLNETQLQELMVDAMLNPGTARSLMMKATPKNVESIGFELLQRARARGFGAASGGLLPRPAQEPRELQTQE